MRGRLLNEKERELLFSKIVKGSDCWDWNGSVDGSGYPKVQFRRVGRILGKSGMFKGSRLMYLDQVGDIPDGMKVLHRCDNEKCMNPKHLYLGTQADNMRDAAKRKRYRYKRAVEVDGVEYESFIAAGRALGLSWRVVRTRAMKEFPGYRLVEDAE